jgi:adenylosuccinate synthase
MKIDSGKFNISIGGQWGSEGKGLLNQYLSLTNHIDIAVNNCSANAGHSFVMDNIKYIAKFLPVSGILNNRSTIYLCSGSILNVNTLLSEIKYFDIDKNRIAIHPICSIIEDNDIFEELKLNSSLTKIASTQTGGGHALARKILRSAKTARDISELHPMIQELDLHYYMDQGCTVLMEVPQGLELSLNSLHYPYVTSRNININSALDAANVHPSYLGKVCAIIRTLPIRVGHIINGDSILGNSGPVDHDMSELDWEDLNIIPEFTTVTKRKRRIFNFGKIQYKRMLNILKPDYILLNFCNYLKKSDLRILLRELNEITHLGIGDTPENIILNHGHF